MLSICIPVYNKNIVPLVNTLSQQCTNSEIPFEIICQDDGSDVFFKEKNNLVATSLFVHYSELSQNVGRAVIRNLLAAQAKYEYILYLDSDVSIERPDFIKNYLSCILTTNPVVIGGVSYAATLIHPNTKLHYTYGTQRESKPALLRNKKPYSSFLTGNLLVQKKIVQDIQFLPTLKEYGHEDTLFGMDLKKRSIPVLHIDNPIIHEGLETNEVFIEKQLTAVRNLSSLIKQGNDMTGISLYDVFLVLKKYRLTGMYIFCFGLLKPLVYRVLVSGISNWLVLFDALRLYELSRHLEKSK